MRQATYWTFELEIACMHNCKRAQYALIRACEFIKCGNCFQDLNEIKSFFSNVLQPHKRLQKKTKVYQIIGKCLGKLN